MSTIEDREKIIPEQGLEKAYGYLNSMLVSGEKLLKVAIQRRLFALDRRRIMVSATSGRFIGMTRGLLGGFTPIDVRWQDLKDAQIKAGIFGSTLYISALSQPDLASGGKVYRYQFGGLRKDEAQEIYKIAQAHEQAWREKRRQRELEELRAKSGGFGNFANNSGFAGGSAPGEAGNEASSVERLKKARQMLEEGLISDSEYETTKSRIINEL
ncbi:hypothetical protein [Erwinia sp. ErVv1]|uniref:hypothetical protein n=1 Tax=Erwinia sp. ErVv1 TaxID=1603299 RepID=UPI00082A0515|nr:hypothetical protein [Erwinia sp. ErVv1]